MRILLAAIFAAFFMSTASAQMFPAPLRIACTENPADLYAKIKKDGMQEVWRKTHSGGGEMIVFQNLSNGMWVQLGTFAEITCVISSGGHREVGT
ncbi:hypothetical protein [Sneathiella glossodoripedis]|uniref:hypothetical protein n=1 Tax=Sneathiella glossodoripedis TaxID=418853 RepID=UPI000472E9FA|nr:hypothetical protein [Sneathiella glossodoripedis]